MNKPFLLLSIALGLAGCASERFVLLPSPEGRATSIVIRDADGERVINTPYAGAVRRLGSVSDYQSGAEEVNARYGDVLSAMPPRARSYVLYFQSGSNQLTPESEADYLRVREEIMTRAASEVLVIGHTDSVGASAGNDALSRKRADAVRERLIASGIPAEKVEATGRGERDLLVNAGDNVDEPRNRRVEISVR